MSGWAYEESGPQSRLSGAFQGNVPGVVFTVVVTWNVKSLSPFVKTIYSWWGSVEAVPRITQGSYHTLTGALTGEPEGWVAAIKEGLRTA